MVLILIWAKHDAKIGGLWQDCSGIFSILIPYKHRTVDGMICNHQMLVKIDLEFQPLDMTWVLRFCKCMSGWDRHPFFSPADFLLKAIRQRKIYNVNPRLIWSINQGGNGWYSMILKWSTHQTAYGFIQGWHCVSYRLNSSCSSNWCLGKRWFRVGLLVLDVGNGGMIYIN